ncbi:MAG: DNA alkylation repair protein [archaeon]|jgi:3-methyladenine DNA glycosylase AlkD|nr:DNA alkylation repair protein [archaeon]
MDLAQIIKKLKTNASKKNIEGMARFGIDTSNAIGVSMPVVRKIAREIGKDHSLALQLWDSGIHEARILASIVGEPNKVSEKQFEKWVADFNSWDVCDQCCGNLLDKTPFAWKKAVEFTSRKKEFVKRTGFVLMATLSVHDKEADDKKFERFFPLIKKHATDERNFVKKAVNWALRQIGKRNIALNKKAITAAKEIIKIDSKAAHWIATDALRELQGEAVQKRLA